LSAKWCFKWANFYIPFVSYSLQETIHGLACGSAIASRTLVVPLCGSVRKWWRNSLITSRSDDKICRTSYLSRSAGWRRCCKVSGSFQLLTNLLSLYQLPRDDLFERNSHQVTVNMKMAYSIEHLFWNFMICLFSWHCLNKVNDWHRFHGSWSRQSSLDKNIRNVNYGNKWRKPKIEDESAHNSIEAWKSCFYSMELRLMYGKCFT